MPISLHSHSGEFCKHGDGSLQSMVERAHSLGFISYGLSEHMPRFSTKFLYPEEVLKTLLLSFYSFDISQKFGE